MTDFDQRHQVVNHQINVGGDMVTVTGDHNVVGAGNTVIFVQDMLLLGWSPDQNGDIPWMRPVQHEQHYLAWLSQAYRAFFRDRFVHQAMELMGTPDSSLCADISEDPLLVELVALLDDTSPATSEDEISSDDREIRTRPITDLNAGLSEYHTIVLLGEPGSGKTSALLWLLGGWSGDKLPVFASLSRYTSGPFVEFLTQQWSVSLAEALRVADGEHRAELEASVATLATSLSNYLVRGQAVLFLDALNELPRDEGYRERLRQLRTFIDTAAKQGNWIIVSCRQNDYTESLQPLQRVEIRPLDNARIQRFLNAYLGVEAGNAAWLTLGEARYARLRELARNPFLLAALVAISRAGKQDLPTARAALLNRLSVASIGWEKRKRHPDWVDLPEQEKVLAGVALTMTLQGRTVVTKTDLVNRLPEGWCFDPGRRKPLLESVLELAQGARMLRWASGPDGGTVAFEHQLWQEYYTAYMLSRLDDAEWRGLARYLTGQPDLVEPFDLVRSHLHDPNWRSVILMLSGCLDKGSASRFLESILQADSRWEEYLYRDRLLAAACLAEGATVRMTVVEIVLAQLQTARQLGIRPLTRRVDRATSGALLALRRSDELLALCRDGKIWWEVRLVAAGALERLGQMNQATTAWLLLAKDKHLGGKVRQQAAERLENTGHKQAAFEAWSALLHDPRAGKGPRRAARHALKRLR